MNMFCLSSQKGVHIVFCPTEQTLFVRKAQTSGQVASAVNLAIMFHALYNTMQKFKLRYKAIYLTPLKQRVQQQHQSLRSPVDRKALLCVGETSISLISINNKKKKVQAKYILNCPEICFATGICMYACLSWYYFAIIVLYSICIIYEKDELAEDMQFLVKISFSLYFKGNIDHLTLYITPKLYIITPY